jgi:hypothetical protein
MTEGHGQPSQLHHCFASAKFARVSPPQRNVRARGTCTDAIKSLGRARADFDPQSSSQAVEPGCPAGSPVRREVQPLEAEVTNRRLAAWGSGNAASATLKRGRASSTLACGTCIFTSARRGAPVFNLRACVGQTLSRNTYCLPPGHARVSDEVNEPGPSRSSACRHLALYSAHL